MIQRIQSIYLFGGALLLALFVGASGEWTVVVAATHAALPWVAYTLSSIGGLLGFVAVFLYKNRTTQAKVVSGAQWLNLILILVLAACLGMMSLGNGGGDFSTSGMTYVMLLLPFVAYVLFSLASRAVRKDVELVRSADRLR